MTKPLADFRVTSRFNKEMLFPGSFSGQLSQSTCQPINQTGMSVSTPSYLANILETSAPARPGKNDNGPNENIIFLWTGTFARPAQQN